MKVLLSNIVASILFFLGCALLLLIGTEIVTNISGFHLVMEEAHGFLRDLIESAFNIARVAVIIWLSLKFAEKGVTIWREHNVIRPGIHGPVQAIKGADGSMVPVPQPSLVPFDQARSIDDMKKLVQFASTLATASKRLDTFIEEEKPAVAALPAPKSSTSPIIHLSDTYDVPVNDVLSGRKLICGISGSGKSNTVAAYMEEIGRLRVPLVLADTQNEYESLCDPLYLPYGVLAGLNTGEYHINAQSAELFGRYILDHNLQVILNLQSYSADEAALVMNGIITGMRIWAQERENERRPPSEFVLEEATQWFPQNSGQRLVSDEIYGAFQGTFFNFGIRQGRKNGQGTTVVCQKLAELDKQAMQSDTKILHRQTEINDLKRYKELGIEHEETSTLANGEAYLFTSRISKKKVHIRERYTKHSANTPGYENLQYYHENYVPKMAGNFAEIAEISGEKPINSESFEQPGEPFRNISDFRRSQNSPVSPANRGVPEMIRKEIEERYQNGMKRTDIRDDLQLNGDQYWMVREVCDGVDVRRKAE